MGKFWIHECKMTWKTLLIWALSVGGFCFICFPMYSSLQDSVKQMADMYANMGAMSTAFGMDKMSLATLTGFYATEISIMFSLGGAMYAAICGSCILSKEEEGHTAEFLYTLPLSRMQITGVKFISVLWNVLVFNVTCAVMFVFGFIIMNEKIPLDSFMRYHQMQFVMQLEIACICFAISSFARKSMIGPGLGLAIILYGIDVMARIIPAMEKCKYITPYYYSNAADIFSEGFNEVGGLLVGISVMVVSIVIAFVVMSKKNLRS